jgi:membrane protein DedA with SNARE-associated domain
MDLYGLIINLLGHYPVLAVILASIIGTEPIIFLIFLMASGSVNFSLFMIFLITLVVLIGMDTLYYYIGKSNYFKKFVERIINKKKHKITLDKIKKKSHDNMFLSLLLSKLVYGIRQGMVLYFGYHKVKYSKFIKKDILSLIIFWGLLIPIIWYLGYGIGASFEYIRRVELIISYGILIVLLMYLVGKVIIDKILLSNGNSINSK